MNLSNLIREDLAQRGYTVGSWLALGSPMAAEVMALAGFRWLCIDAEHSPIGLAEVCHMIRAVESRGATPIVRVPDDNPTMIGQVLDAGAMGIVVPHVRNAEQAARIAQACRYTPTGARSVGTSRGFTFGRSYHPVIDQQVAVIPQIEDPDGIEQVEQIVATEGIDIGLIGPKDLSFNMGIEQGSPEHEDAIQRFLNGCRRAGKPAGIPLKSREEVIVRRKQGFEFFSINSDFRLLEAAAYHELRSIGD